MVGQTDLWQQLPEGQRRSLRALIQTPLIGGEDLAQLHGRNPSGVHASFRGLRGRELAASVQLGCLRPQTERHFLPDWAQRGLGLISASWHQPARLNRLLERFPSVEWLYQAGAAVTDLGAFCEWQWVDAVGFDAAARYEEGWVCFFWVGPLRVESRFAELVEGLGEDLESMAVGDPRPRPSLLCCVASDRYQVEMILGVARRWGMDDWVRVWCIADDAWYGAVGHLPGRGWIRQPAYRRKAGPGAWEHRVRESLWSWDSNLHPAHNLRRALPAIKAAPYGAEIAKLVGASMNTVRAAGEPEATMQTMVRLIDEVEQFIGQQCECAGTAGRAGAKSCPAHEAAEILRRVVGHIHRPVGTQDIARTLYAVAEWPGSTVAMVRALLREKSHSRRAQRALMRMTDLGLLVRWKAGTRYRYRVSEAGMRIVAAFDRATPSVLWQRIQIERWRDPGSFTTHEYGVVDLMRQFAAAGCPVANGWREWEDMGAYGAIAPDAVAFLQFGPFGAGWHYLEYELSAKARSRMAQKLHGFDSPRRKNAWPLLMVCANDAAERNASQWAIQHGVQVATTTIKRLRDHSAVGNEQCWQVAGESVQLG